MTNKSKLIITSDLPKKLKQARKLKGLTQGQLTRKIGVDIQRISKYERGVLVPTTEIMVKLSDALDISLDYLLKNGKNRVTGKIRDEELIDKVIQIDTLPDKDRQILKSLLEAFIKKHQFEELAAR
ncbi:MAG: helix-turn-helix transcriptional regulator [Deltaproteobacteria bacterium]|nr:helix-turn-helix transcriptional regulator [Deltaproteobacteria bacterium]